MRFYQLRSTSRRRPTMTDDQQDRSIHDEPSRGLSRRDFVALSVAATLAAARVAASAAELPVIESSVEVKTPDGSSDAVFIHPATGSYPGVLVWPDAGPAPCDARYWQTHRC
jgi:carboxymethylenebutenolidase